MRCRGDGKMKGINKMDLWRCILSIIVVLVSFSAFAEDNNRLETIEIRMGEGEKLQVVLGFSEPVSNVQNFALEDPAIVVVDFPLIKNNVSSDVIEQLSTGVLNNVEVVETQERVRVVLNLANSVPFEVQENGKTVVVTLESVAAEERTKMRSIAHAAGDYEVKSFDFRRGERGEARLMVNLSNSKVTIDVEEDRNKTIIKFSGAVMSHDLERRYNVVDFATPVQTIDIMKEDTGVEIVVEADGDYDKIAYQMDDQFIFEVREKFKEEGESDSVLAYTGNRISLNFQDIEIRAVLQIIADFSGFNIITNDSVSGNITLRLQNLPWDQALDIILKSKALDQRKIGNVILVGPAEELANREKIELEGKKQIQDLGELKSELIQINYADASEVATLLKDQSNSLLTSRGNVSVDRRTNTLLVQDIASKLNEIRALLKKIDIPVRQVEISTQIITADDTVEDVLGIRFGGGANSGIGSRRVGVGSTVDRARAIADFTDPTTGAPRMPAAGAVIAPSEYNAAAGPSVNNTEGFFSDLKVFGGTALGATGLSPASVGLALARLPNGTLLDLELQALEYESRVRTVAKPKLITMDQSKASVEKGVDIPYAESSSSGATSVAYRSAALKLEVTPHITPNDKISMDLEISNDSQGATVDAGPVVNTNRIATKVLADDGETIVLGGVLQLTETKQFVKVPFFGDLPLVGGLFRNNLKKSEPKELMIFLTPKIVHQIEN